MGDHDQNFKNLILDFPRQALEFFAAEEARDIPADAVITPIRQELLKERMGDRFFETDVPLLVEFKDGSCEGIVFCIEENSTADPSYPMRQAIYAIQLALLLKTRRVVPVAVYPFAPKAADNSFALSGDHGVYLEFKGLSITLPVLEASEHRVSSNIVERLCLPLMKHEPLDTEEIVSSACEGLITLAKERELQLKYIGFILRYSQLDEAQVNSIAENFSDPFKGKIMSTYESILQKGIAKGKAEGRVESIVDLFNHGVLTVEQARHYLEALAASGDAPREIVDAALNQLPGIQA